MLQGPFPKKMLRKGAFTAKHFDSDPAMSFMLYEEDPVSRKIVSVPMRASDTAHGSPLLEAAASQQPAASQHWRQHLHCWLFQIDAPHMLLVTQHLCGVCRAPFCCHNFLLPRAGVPHDQQPQGDV